MFLCYSKHSVEVCPMSDININENVNEEVENKPYDVEIEEARKELYKSYSTSRKISNILMFVIVGAIVGIMFLIISNNQVLKIVGYCLAGALVAGMIVYYVLNRKKFPDKTKNYVTKVNEAFNHRMFSDPNFSEIKYDKEEKLVLDDLIGDGIYKDATGINSRNVLRGVYRGHHFLYGEAALIRPSTRKQQVPPLFVGRYISLPNQMKFDNRFVLTIKNPKEPLDLPNAVDDLVVLEEKDNWVVYGPENANYHNVLKNKTISQLHKLNVEGHLLNVNVVFWAGHTAVYISYDDAIMSVPFDKPLDKEGFEKSFNDLIVCFNAITEE